MSHSTNWPVADDVLPVRSWPTEDLVKLDTQYRQMYRMHERCHVGLIEEMGKVRDKCGQRPDILEIACGTGWNIKNFLDAGFEYAGMDLSETAVAVAMMRHPMGKFINAGIDDAQMIASESFETVFCSSLLEHLADYRDPLAEMFRIANRQVYVMFFEGLSNDSEDSISQYVFDNPDYWVSGEKYVAQSKAYGGNYFWNRYSKSSISTALTSIGVVDFEFIEPTSRSYLTNETVLKINK